MIKAYLRLTAALLLLCLIALSLIVLQPNDNAALRSFFNPPPGCAAPCFLGIRLGVTTQEEAAQILHRQPWVDTITLTSSDMLTWTWNGQQPAFVSSYSSDAQLGTIEFAQGVASRISLNTSIRWGDVLIARSAPDRNFVLNAVAQDGFRYEMTFGAYRDQGFQVEAITACPIQSRDDLWYSPVFIQLPISPMYDLAPSEKKC
ncbi:MAG TPA: hypothetical protein VHD90_13275 [Phototrophicaceae bacterium]|nr:hypothetical protein [Phototrophicaceae bacterium]